MPDYGHDTEVVNPCSPSIGDEGMPEIMKGSVGYACLPARPLEGGGGAGGMIPWVHLRRVICQASTLTGLTNTHGRRTYLVAVLRVLVNVWFSAIRRPSSILV